MTFAGLKSEILDLDLCTRCGACEVVCPKNLIGFEGIDVRFQGKTTAECGSCSDCLTVCPGKDPDVPLSELVQFGRKRTSAERWLGVYREVLGARATSPEVFRRSASGGSSTALLQHAMRSMGLKHALVMGRDRERPWRAAPVICDHVDELPSRAQSTYQLAPFLGPLRRVLLEHPQDGIAMSGLACDVQAVRKLQRMDTEIGHLARKNIRFVLEVGCSSSTRPEGTESIITELLQCSLEDVVDVRYRDGEYPGQIAVTTKNGDRHTLPFWQAVRHFKDNKTHRCLSCGDWLSGLADISVADGDPNIFDGSLGRNSIEKHGRVFVRTDTGTTVVRSAVDQGYLEAWPIELAGLNLGLERKKNRRADYERKAVPIPEGPIEGHRESREVISDDDFLAVPEAIVNTVSVGAG